MPKTLKLQTLQPAALLLTCPHAARARMEQTAYSPSMGMPLEQVMQQRAQNASAAAEPALNSPAAAHVGADAAAATGMSPETGREAADAPVIGQWGLWGGLAAAAAWALSRAGRSA